jgi:hypothetical protein
MTLSGIVSAQHTPFPRNILLDTKDSLFYTLPSKRNFFINPATMAIRVREVLRQRNAYPTPRILAGI